MYDRHLQWAGNVEKFKTHFISNFLFFWGILFNKIHKYNSRQSRIPLFRIEFGNQFRRSIITAQWWLYISATDNENQPSWCQFRRCITTTDANRKKLGVCAERFWEFPKFYNHVDANRKALDLFSPKGCVKSRAFFDLRRRGYTSTKNLKTLGVYAERFWVFPKFYNHTDANQLRSAVSVGSCADV